jgi:hypothetical protein
MTIPFSDRIRIAPDVLFRVVADEAVLVNLNTEVYLGLNEIGTRMWDVLNSAGSVECAFETLLREYEVEPAQLRADLAAFVDELLAQKLVEIGPAIPA